MKSTVETLSPTRVRLAVEVPFEELKPSFAAAYKRIGAQIKVPGFRPGKVPGRILEQRIGRPAILEEVINEAVPKAYSEAIRENEIRVIGQPDIEVTKVDDGETVAFTAEVDIRPEIALGGLSSLAVTVDDIEVTEAEIDEQVQGLRDRFATLTAVERPVAHGDYVSIDLEATIDGATLEDGTTTGLSHEVGSGELIDGLDDTLLGMNAGDAATFQTTLSAGESAGQTADIAVTVRSVKEKDMPDLDDEFAQTASEFDTIDELRGDIRGRLERVKAMQQGAQARDRLVDAVLDAVDVPLPESIVTGEVEWRQHSLTHELEENGQSLERYLELEGQSAEEFEAELRSNAEKAVKNQLILDAYADAEEIQVGQEDLMQHIVVSAQRYGVAPEEFAAQVTEGGNLPALVADIRRTKALGKLLSTTTVTDASGNAVDIAALRPPGALETVPDQAAGDPQPSLAAGADDEGDAATAIPTDD